MGNMGGCPVEFGTPVGNIGKRAGNIGVRAGGAHRALVSRAAASRTAGNIRVCPVGFGTPVGHIGKRAGVCPVARA